jgi:hypothetical protein
MTSRRFLLIVLSLSLAGCQNAEDGLTINEAPADVSGPAASAIAGDLAGRYAEQAGATGVPIRLNRDMSDFSVALEAALKGWGYAVIGDNGEAGAKMKEAHKPIRMDYSILAADGQVLARLSTDRMQLGRAYSISKGMATPASPLSLMKNN